MSRSSRRHPSFDHSRRGCRMRRSDHQRWWYLRRTIRRRSPIPLYLIEYDLPLTLLQFALYRTAGGELLLTTSQLLPVPNADEMMGRARSAPATRAAAHEGREAQTRLDRLLSSPAMPDGQPLTVVVPPQVTNVDSAAVTAWLDRDPVRRRALWRRILKGRSSGFSTASATRCQVSFEHSSQQRLNESRRERSGARTGFPTTTMGETLCGTRTRSGFEHRCTTYR